jgi:hypothetical protein
LIYYIKSNLWQQLFVIQPIEAESEEAAREQFTKALEGKARDVVIEEVITDEARLEEVLKEEYDQAEDIETTIH